MKKRTRHTPNKIIDCGDYYEICIYNQKCKEISRAKIDKEDLTRIKQYKWCLTNGYAITRIKSKFLSLHRLILGQKQGYLTDHINGNGLDNRKQNLRFVTNSQNGMNSKVLGIHFIKSENKWRTQVCVNYKRIYLGIFKNKEDAIKARRAGEQKYFKEFARTDRSMNSEVSL